VIERLATVDAARGDLTRAARLMGAADILPNARGISEPGWEHASYERCVAEVRGSLGAEVFAAAFAAGRDRPLDEAVADALDKADGG
jgi:hypothetical protein